MYCCLSRGPHHTTSKSQSLIINCIFYCNTTHSKNDF
ncbi:hypothetical protein BSUA_01053 [Bacillus subtilis subsp. subtilis str. JH642 substr. AG174]|nr:Hypothetical protein YhdS [Bacillus subtilis subsp. subtilis str. BSP1]AIC39342.1 hypothetical protein BSUA_01053 [Bacillus subtilis subsp. subtilis str. JH642 substr. AG174]AIC43574.1 hypothetical protein BSUB_01053 [Bacillus subtilis subsp. subtilis str. AG1839]CAA74503.1 hypothetical protein [Bacillus subtilis subsp. subtilis str. 168]